MRVRTSTVILVALGLVGGSGCDRGHPGPPAPSATATKGTLTVGAYDFTESRILANLFAEVLAKAGYRTSVSVQPTRDEAEPALERGEVDVVPDYLGTFTNQLNARVHGSAAKPVASGDWRATLRTLRALARTRHLVVLDPSRAADQDAFAVTRAFAVKNRLRRLSDLARYRGRLVLGGPPECPKRAFCQVGLERLYGLRFAGFKPLDAGGPRTLDALHRGIVQLGLVFTSDAGLKTYDLQVLEDDKHLETVDNVVPVLSEKAATPDVTAALQKVADTLTTADLVDLNERADVQHQDPAAVAHDWLTANGLL